MHDGRCPLHLIYGWLVSPAGRLMQQRLLYEGMDELSGLQGANMGNMRRRGKDGVQDD